MPAPQVEVQTKQSLVLAQALGLVTEVENTVTGYAEIRLSYQDKQTGLAKTQVLGADWQAAEEYLLSDRNRRVLETLEDALKIGQKAIAKAEKQGLYQKLMTYLSQVEKMPGGKDNPEYRKQEEAIEEYVKTYSLFVASSSSDPQRLVEIPKTSTTSLTEVAAPDSNLEKFTKLAETCYRHGNPSNNQLQMLEHFRQRYKISQETAEQVIAQFVAKFSPGQNQQQAMYDYGLMYRAFLENDGEIDFEEQSQLLELQEELGLDNHQVSTMEDNIRAEVGLSASR